MVNKFSDGNDWTRYWAAAEPILLRRQWADGVWPQGEAGPAYGTAMALIILQIPNNDLPILQR